MRPKLLEIEGLQSFTDTQVIDFEKLGETGLFGIFGPTGSGKSTILDAITFALYGRVKRAENGTQGIINSRCDTARVAFTFELGKDSNKKTYRVERTYRRRKKSPNSCEPKIARLIEVTRNGEIPLCDRATDVSNYVRELLGLNIEDFTRAVVLPQNSFHEFLMLKNSERRSMLERLFYLEEYGKQLNDKIGRRMSSLRSRIDMLTGELAGYADASEEALNEAKTAMETALEERKNAQKELKRVEKLFNESKEVWGLVSELEDLKRKEDSLRLAEAEISKKRILLEKAVRADSLAEIIRRNRETGQKLNEAKKQLDSIMAVLPKVSDQLDQTKSEYERVKRDAASNQQRLVEQRTRLKDALGVKAELKVLTDRISELQISVNEKKNAIGTKEAEIAQENTKLGDREQRLEALVEGSERLRTEPEYRQKMQLCATLEKDAAALDKTLDQLMARKGKGQETIDKLEKQLAEVTEKIAESLKRQEELSDSIKLHESKKAGDRDSVMRSLEQVHKARGIYQVLKLRENEAELARVRVEKLRAAFGEHKMKTAELEKARNDAERLYDKCRRYLEECRLELDKNTARLLAKELKEGQPCPVCGSLDHPSPAAHSGSDDGTAPEQKVEAAQRGLDEAEAALREAERKALISAESLKTISDQLDQAVMEHERKNRDLEDERQKLPDEWKTLDLEQIRSEIEKTDSDLRRGQKEIEEWETKAGELRENAEKLSDELAKLRMDENKIRTELRVNREALAQLESELKQASENLTHVRRQLTEQLKGYTVTNAAAELARLSENDRKLKQIEDEIRKIREEAEKTKARISVLNDERSRLDADRIRLEADISGLLSQRQEKEKRLYELSQGADIEEGIKQIDDELNKLVQADKRYSTQIEQLEKEYNELNVNRSKLDSSVSLYSEGLAADSEKLQRALAESGFSSPEEAESYMIPGEQQKEIKAEIEAYDQEAVNIKAHRRLLETKLGSRSITEEEWNRIEQSYRELVERSNKSISDCEVAKNNYESITKKHARWKEIQQVLADVSHKYGLYNQISRLLNAARGKDNSFIDYIAEERLRYIAAKASTLLEVMTRQRYSLEVDAESGFIIRDGANGGIHRNVTTLSGGETFLTSLSLALALSEQIHLKGHSPLEFFFLDEGFGTLDRKLLDLVMDSLERLCSDDRVIGIISHVPELRQRIGRCLIVTPPTFEGEGSRVRIEKS